VAKERTVDNLEQDLVSVRQEVGDLKKAARQNQEQLGLNISSLEAQLLGSKVEQERLGGAITLITDARDAVTSDLQKELDRNSLLENEISSLNSKLTEIIVAKEKTVDNLEQDLVSARQEGDDVKKAARQEQEQHSSDISSLEAQLLESKAEKEKLGVALQSMTDSRDAVTSNLQKELDGNSLLKNEISTLNSKLSDTIVAKERTVDNLEQDLVSVRQEVDNLKKVAHQEQEQHSSNISSLEARLFESKAEQGRLDGAITLMTDARDAVTSNLQKELDGKEQLNSDRSSLEAQLLESKTKRDKLGGAVKSMAQVMTRVNGEKIVLACKNKELSEQNNTLLNGIENANDIISILRIELGGAKKLVCDQQEQHCFKMSLAETGRRESKQEQERLRHVVKSLKTSHEDALTDAENQRTGFDRAKETASQEHERLRSKISALMTDLIESKKQMSVCESKMDLSGLVHPRDRTFDDILSIINKECSDIVAKSKIAARELESSHGIHVLTEQASKFELHNFALDKFTNSVVEVETDGEVKRLLISFCHMIESAEVSVL